MSTGGAVVAPDPQVAAELAYQRALALLHDARADLGNVAAARRRLAYDRTRLTPEEADGAARDLDVRFAELSARADRLRDEAVALREQLRRHDEANAEPEDVPEDLGGEGFEQPPFLEAP
jgi:hypothetical protein